MKIVKKKQDENVEKGTALSYDGCWVALKKGWLYVDERGNMRLEDYIHKFNFVNYMSGIGYIWERKGESDEQQN